MDKLSDLQNVSNRSFTKPELNRFRAHSGQTDSRADDFVFVRSILRNSTEPVVPLMAGITKPDPNYFIDLRINGFGKRYLTVLEYVISGCGSIYCNGVKRTLHKGYFYILHPSFTGSYYADTNDPFTKKWINLNGRLVPALMKAYGITEQVNIFPSCSEAEQYLDRIHEILFHYNEQDPAEDDLKIAQILLSLFDHITRARRNQEKDGSNGKALFQKIANYIESNIVYEKLTVATLSEVFHVSSRTLDRIFKAEIGSSPSKFIKMKKIEAAQKMLAENYSVSEISEMLSFSSNEYFWKIFTDTCGISPSKYKKKQITKQ